MQNPLTVGVGGRAEIDVRIVNTSGQAETYDLTLIQPALSAGATLEVIPSQVALQPGEVRFVRAIVSVADVANNGCQFIDVYDELDAPIFSMKPTDPSRPGQESGFSINVVGTVPQLRDVLPLHNGRVGSQSVTFSAYSDMPVGATVYYAPFNAEEYNDNDKVVLTSVDGTQLYRGVVDGLSNGRYKWYVKLTGGCDPNTQVHPTPERTFTVVESVEFIRPQSASYYYQIADDYDVTEDIDERALEIGLVNSSSQPQQVTVDVINPYEDLIVGFIDSGSLDRALTLQPNTSTNLTLRVFTQHAEQFKYDELSLRLTTADGTQDIIPLVLDIKQPTADLELRLSAPDTSSLATTARLTNNGDTITDLRLWVRNRRTGRPAPFILFPSFDHAYLRSGESVIFTIVPQNVTDDDNDGDEYEIVASSRAFSDEEDQGNEPFDEGEAFEVITPVSGGGSGGNGEGGITNQCGEGMVMQTCRQPGGQLEILTNNWYCTNRPNVSTPLNIMLPVAGSDGPEITDASVSFQTSSLRYSTYSHTSAISLNGTALGYAIIDGQPREHIFDDIPTGVLSNFQDGISINTLNLQSIHDNTAHYSVGSQFSLSVSYGEFTSQQCVPEGTPDTGSTPDCAVGITPQPEEPQLTLDLALADGLDPNNLQVGDIIPVSATINNVGSAATDGSVVLSLNVPDGLAPISVSYGNESLMLTDLDGWGDLLGGLIEEILALISGQELALTVESENTVNITYNVGSLEAFSDQTFEFDLIVEAEIVGEFAITGSLSNVATDTLFMRGVERYSALQQNDEIENLLILQVSYCVTTNNGTGAWNIRSLPNGSSNIVGSVPKDATVRLDGWTQINNPDQTVSFFYKVSISDANQQSVTGWVSGSLMGKQHIDNAKCQENNLPYIFVDGQTENPVGFFLAIQPTIPLVAENVTYITGLQNPSDLISLNNSNVTFNTPRYSTQSGDLVENFDIQSMTGNPTVSGDESTISWSPDDDNTLQSFNVVGTYPITDNGKRVFTSTALTSGDLNLSFNLSVVLSHCRTTHSSDLSVSPRGTPNASSGDIEAGLTFGIIGQNITEEWLYVTYQDELGFFNLGWVEKEQLGCTGLPFVGDDGNVLFLPDDFDEQTECLATLKPWNNSDGTSLKLYATKEAVALVSNDEGVTPNDLNAEQLVVVDQMYIDLQFAHIRYVTPEGVEGEGWVRVTANYYEGFLGLAIIGGQGCGNQTSGFSLAKAQDMQIGEGDLPICTATQFVNCRPEIECSWIFGCTAQGEHLYEAHLLSPFGNLNSGCSNERCEPDTCPAWPIKKEVQGVVVIPADQRHCGEDLQIIDNNQVQTTANGPVFNVNSGYHCGFAGGVEGGNTFKIRFVEGSYVYEYQYTHIDETRSPGNAFTFSYVMSGVQIGNYGLFGATEPTQLHVHLVNKVYNYVAGVHPCNHRQTVPNESCAHLSNPNDPRDTCPSNPYLRVPYENH